MKKIISILMIIGALMCVLYIGAAAEPTNVNSGESSSDVGGGNNETSSSVIGTVSIDGASSEENSSDTESEIDSDTVSEDETSSTATSSRYGANAYDPTVGNSGDEFGGPASDTTIEYESLPTISKDNGDKKNIFDLSNLLLPFFIIGIIFMVASIGALVFVNRREFVGDTPKKKGAKTKGGKALRKKKDDK